MKKLFSIGLIILTIFSLNGLISAQTAEISLNYWMTGVSRIQYDTEFSEREGAVTFLEGYYKISPRFDIGGRLSAGNARPTSDGTEYSSTDSITFNTDIYLNILPDNYRINIRPFAGVAGFREIQTHQENNNIIKNLHGIGPVIGVELVADILGNVSSNMKVSLMPYMYAIDDITINGVGDSYPTKGADIQVGLSYKVAEGVNVNGGYRYQKTEAPDITNSWTSINQGLYLGTSFSF